MIGTMQGTVRWGLVVSLGLVACGGPAPRGDAGAIEAGSHDGGTPATDAGPRPFDASFTRLEGDVTHPLDDTLRLNHVQAEATHNSYHRPPSEDPLADWAYEHAPLDVQLEEQGVRAVELDLHWDPAAGRFDVFHLTLVDQVSTCPTFLDCLATLRTWSDAHPGHHAITVQLEVKSGGDRSVYSLGVDIDAEIRTIFSDELLVLPDNVRGTHATLAEAIQEDGWPTLGATRGRFLFALDCDRALCVAYANDGAGLAGRVAFADSEPGDPWLAFRVLNSPGADVRAAVEAGLLVRTRAISMPEALNASRSALEAELSAALDSGAHFISTDVPIARPDIAAFVEIPGGSPSRCNPVSAPSGCSSLDIEDPARLVP